MCRKDVPLSHDREEMTCVPYSVVKTYLKFNKLLWDNDYQIDQSIFTNLHKYVALVELELTDLTTSEKLDKYLDLWEVEYSAIETADDDLHTYITLAELLSMEISLGRIFKGHLKNSRHLLFQVKVVEKFIVQAVKESRRLLNRYLDFIPEDDEDMEAYLSVLAAHLLMDFYLEKISQTDYKDCSKNTLEAFYKVALEAFYNLNAKNSEMQLNTHRA